MPTLGFLNTASASRNFILSSDWTEFSQVVQWKVDVKRSTGDPLSISPPSVFIVSSRIKRNLFLIGLLPNSIVGSFGELVNTSMASYQPLLTTSSYTHMGQTARRLEDSACPECFARTIGSQQELTSGFFLKDLY